MASDGRKGLELTWNVLNLVDSAAMHGSSLKYAWLSDGTKVSARTDDGSGNGVVKRYLGSFVYTSTSGSSAEPPMEVESIAWDEGRILMSLPMAAVDSAGFIIGEEAVIDSLIVVDTAAVAGWFRDCWYAADHLGNVRAVIDINPELIVPEILEQNDYLPFGTRIQNSAFATATDNRWRYAGKEEQRFAFGSAAGSLNLSLLDFGARMYDPFTARWTAVDPMAKLSHPFGPFSYCAGNPIISRDRDGNFPETVWDVASLMMGVNSFVSNVKEGNVGGAILDGVGILADAAAVAMPFVPGGVSAGIKAARAGDKVADAIRSAGKIDEFVDASKASSIATATKRGLVNEAKTLDKLGEVKNTKSFTVTIDGKDVTAIPDINSSKQVGEIKDTKTVYNTRQIKAERKAAESQGKDFNIYTGTETHVSSNIPESEVVRLEWLGPQ